MTYTEAKAKAVEICEGRYGIDGLDPETADEIAQAVEWEGHRPEMNRNWKRRGGSHTLESVDVWWWEE